MPTAAELRTHANAGASVTNAVLDKCIEVADELVKRYIGTAVVPSATLDRAMLLAANECLQQNLSPNGVLNTQYDLGDGTTPLRVGRDPLTPVRPLLREFVGYWDFA